MKDYYKILGVRKSASEKDIRTRWIELMRKFHPDGPVRGGPEDDKSKEINEAYQVLKHTNTRIKYDLERAYQRRRRSFYLRRLFLLFIIVSLAGILGGIYLRLPSRHPITPRVSPPSNSPLHEETVSGAVNPLDTLTVGKKIEEAKGPDALDHATPASIIRKLKQLTTVQQAGLQHSRLDRLKDPNDVQEMPPPKTITRRNETDRLGSAGKRKEPNARKAPQKNQQLADRRDTRHLTPGPETKMAETSGKTPNHEIAQGSMISGQEQVARTGMSTPSQSGEPGVTPPLIASDSSIEEEEKSRSARSTSQIITEEEVREFFVDYAERYSQRDINGFLSFLSLRALQNGRHGFSEIARIYSDFYNQSRELNYRLQDMRIGIYQEAMISNIFFKNVAVVEARYVVDQVLKKRNKKRVWSGEISWILVRENDMLKILFLDYQTQKSTPPRREEGEGR
jgi:hypothetical protein